MVREVSSSSRAAAAGVKPNEIIVEVAGENVSAKSAKEISAMVKMHWKGTAVHGEFRMVTREFTQTECAEAALAAKVKASELKEKQQDEALGATKRALELRDKLKTELKFSSNELDLGPNKTLKISRVRGESLGILLRPRRVVEKSGLVLTQPTAGGLLDKAGIVGGEVVLSVNMTALTIDLERALNCSGSSPTARRATAQVASSRISFTGSSVSC